MRSAIRLPLQKRSRIRIFISCWILSIKIFNKILQWRWLLKWFLSIKISVRVCLRPTPINRLWTTRLIIDCWRRKNGFWKPKRQSLKSVLRLGLIIWAISSQGLKRNTAAVRSSFGRGLWVGIHLKIAELKQFSDFFVYHQICNEVHLKQGLDALGFFFSGSYDDYLRNFLDVL